MFKFYHVISLAFCVSVVCATEVHNLDVHVAQRAKVPLAICIVDGSHKELSHVAERLQDDLMFSGQFDVTVKKVEMPLSKNRIKQLFSQGYPLAVFITDTKHSNAFEWRIYDTTCAHMVKGKKYTKRGSDANGWAHNIADIIWPTLTGQSGFFSTKIAYCKKIDQEKGKSIKHVYVADYDGKHEQVVVNTPTVNVVPRWNHDINNPLVFYSEYTNANVRLMAVNMKKQRRIASNFDGINMLTSFSDDGKKVVYCASRGDGNCQLYYYQKNTFKRLHYTDSKTQRSMQHGNNVSPTLTADGNTLFFCSDFLTGHPQIFKYDMTTDSVERITTGGGYCASPSYCAAKNCIAYIKRVAGVMQVYTYDIATKKHTQMTHDANNKDECSWSPCGNYILACVSDTDRSRLGVYNTLTTEWRYVTSSVAHCDYPAWSPIYSIYPTV
jgi:TolB protein